MGAGGSTPPQSGATKAQAVLTALAHSSGVSAVDLVKLSTPDLHELAQAQDLKYKDLVGYASEIGVDSSELGGITGEESFNSGKILALILKQWVVPAENASASLEADILSAISAARADPGVVAKRVAQRLEHFKGKDFYNPRRAGTVNPTKEGTAAVKDAIRYLDEMEPVEALSPTLVGGLGLSAEDHIGDIGAVGTASHKGSDGAGIDNQCGRYGLWEGSIGQVIWYGRTIHVTDVVDDLIVDDGVENRGHRLAIYNEQYQVAGVAIGPHKVFGQMVVVNFAVGYAPDADKIQARNMAGPPRVEANSSGSDEIKTQWTDLGTCGVCNAKIHGGRVVEVNGRIKSHAIKYHGDCFACASCAKILTGEKFRTEERQLLCMPCWVEAHAPTCTGCAKKIEGGVMNVKSSTDKTKTPWHKECYEKEQAANSEGSGGGGSGARSTTRVLKVAREPQQAASRGGLGRNIPKAHENAESLMDEYAALGM